MPNISLLSEGWDTVLNQYKTNKNKIKLSIKWKVFSFLALFTAIILLILWLTETVFLSDIYRSIKMQELKNSAYEIAQTISSGDLSKTVEDLARKNEYCIIVQDNRGMILAESEATHNCVTQYFIQRPSKITS